MSRHALSAVIAAVAAFLAVPAAEAATAVGLGRPSAPLVPSSAMQRAPRFVEGQILVGFASALPEQARAQAHAQAAAQVIRRLPQLNVDVVAVPAGAVPGAIAAYRRNPDVRYAEPNYLRRLTQTPPLPREYQDPNINYMTEQWGLHNTGQLLYYRWIDEITVEYGVLRGAPDADINFAEAWSRLRNIGSQNIVIAVLDSGVQCDHADLVGKCVEPQVNFSQSGYGRDDILGHGTHVAAIAAANTDNSTGTAGVAWNARLANLKVCYEYDLGLGYILGLCDDAAIAAGLTHAADQGYQVANMSLAGPEQGATLGAAVTYALGKGMLIVAGAGNEYTQDKMYPAGFAGVVAVGATDYFDNLASFSSFGSSWVHLLAPGVNIISAVSAQACYGFPDCYDWKSGTSMATPHVSGAGALVWGYLKSLSRTVDGPIVRDVLLNSAKTTGALGQNFLAWVSKGRLDLNSAITLAETGAPPPPPPNATQVHVGDLDGIGVNQGGTWRAQVTVTVHVNESHAPVAGAIVSGTWSGGIAGTGSCTTSSSGSCTVNSPNISKKATSANYAVNTVTGTNLTYIGPNHDPDNDSNGNSITVPKP